MLKEKNAKNDKRQLNSVKEEIDIAKNQLLEIIENVNQGS